LKALPAGWEATKLGMEQSYSHGLDGLVNASPDQILVPLKTTIFASFDTTCRKSRVRWNRSLA
jgi:hypothetical protein